MTWRNFAIALCAVCLIQTWRACSRSTPAATSETTDCTDTRTHAGHEWGDHDPSSSPIPAANISASDGTFSAYGFKLQVPGWAMALAPQRGENLRSYKDRMLPIALTAIAPQRARVARSRDELAAALHLQPAQLTALDTAAQGAASALEEKVMAAVINGDFAPANFKPMTAVSTARELLDVVDQANQHWIDSLSTDQRAALAQHPFDFGDYLVFSTKWEDLLAAFD